MVFAESLVKVKVVVSVKCQDSGLQIFPNPNKPGINTMLPATITVSAQRGVLPPWMCTLTSFVDTMTLPVSLWILSASSLDRCIMIFKPYKYK